MALFYTLLLCFSFLCVLALFKRIIAGRHNRLPAGVQKLPGPKGMYMS